MMVSWKAAACLAAGNTVVLKPAQVSPLTALKLAELSVYAGFPAGVINVLPGRGTYSCFFFHIIKTVAIQCHKFAKIQLLSV